MTNLPTAIAADAPILASIASALSEHRGDDAGQRFVTWLVAHAERLATKPKRGRMVVPR